MAAHHRRQQDNGAPVLQTNERFGFTVGNVSLSHSQMSSVLGEITKTDVCDNTVHNSFFNVKIAADHKINSVDFSYLGPNCWIITSVSSL